jgi:transcriptional regulator with XRE-family HTH domain
LIQLLVAVRQQAGMRQQALAKKLGKPQSFVAKYEGGERRIDVIEFIAIIEALGADPVRQFKTFLSGRSAKSGRKSATSAPTR